MAIGVVPGLVVGLREGIEAALIIGIILAYLTKIGQEPLRKYVYTGTVAALGASLVAALLFAHFVGEFEGTAEQLFEGVAAILAVVILTSMILWMMTAAKDIRKHVEQRIDVLVDRRHVLGLSSLAFIAVFREGVETVLFAAGLAGVTTQADLVVGIGIGLVVAAFLGFGVYAASWRINLRRFFQGTSVLLIVIAAGLFAFGVHELQEAGVLPWLADPVFAEPLPLGDGQSSPVGYLLRGLVGYNDNPSQLEVVAYGAYWAFTAVVWWGIRTGKIGFVTAPLRGAWVAMRRALRRAPTAEPGGPTR